MDWLGILEPQLSNWRLSKGDSLEPEDHLNQALIEEVLPLVGSIAVGALEVDNSAYHVTGGGGDSLGDISVAARQEEEEQDGEGPKHAGAAVGLEMRRCHLFWVHLCHVLCTVRSHVSVSTHDP